MPKSISNKTSVLSNLIGYSADQNDCFCVKYFLQNQSGKTMIDNIKVTQPIYLGIIYLVPTQYIFRKTNISYPLIRTPTCPYQGVRNVGFSEFCVRTKWMIPYKILQLLRQPRKKFHSVICHSHFNCWT